MLLLFLFHIPYINLCSRVNDEIGLEERRVLLGGRVHERYHFLALPLVDLLATGPRWRGALFQRLRYYLV